MKPPQPIVFLGVLPCFWNRGSIEQPDAPPFRRRPLVLAKQHANEVFHPAAAFAQALEQSDVGKVCKTHGRGPCARRSQSHPAKAISQDETQQVRRTAHRPRPLERPKLARRGLDRSLSVKPRQRCLPKFVQMQFESHVMLESDSIPLGKNFKLARMRESGDPCLNQTPRPCHHGFPHSRE